MELSFILENTEEMKKIANIPIKNAPNIHTKSTESTEWKQVCILQISNHPFWPSWNEIPK